VTWSDFLKYAKYIAVFYGLAFVIGVVGIWMPNPTRTVLTAAMFFCAALAGNVALGFYHNNHRSEMKMAKNIHIARQDGVQSITSDAKGLAVVSEDDEVGAGFLNLSMREAIEEEVRKQRRGY